MKKQKVVALTTAAVLTLMAGAAQAGVLTTVTRSVSAELIALSGTSGLPVGLNTTYPGASFIFRPEADMSAGATLSVVLTNAKFADTQANVYALCNGTSAVAASTPSSSTATPAAVKLTATAAINGNNVYQFAAGATADAACTGGSSAIEIPVVLTGTSPVTVAVTSTSPAAVSANAVTLYNTQRQFSAVLTQPTTGIINFNSTPASTQFVPTSNGLVTPNSVSVPFQVLSNQNIDITLPVGFADPTDNTSCVASTSFSGSSATPAVFMPITVKGNFGSVSTTSGAQDIVSLAVTTVDATSDTSAPPVVNTGTPTNADEAITSTSTSAVISAPAEVAVCGTQAVGSAQNAAKNLLTITNENGNVALNPADFTVNVALAGPAVTNVIETLLTDTTAISFRLNTTKFAAPYVKFSPDGVEQTYFKLIMKKSPNVTNSLVSFNIIDASGNQVNVPLPAKTLTAGVTTTLTGGDIVTAAQAQGVVVPVQPNGVYQFAGTLEIQATQDNVNVYALNGSGTSFTRVPLRVNPDVYSNGNGDNLPPAYVQ